MGYYAQKAGEGIYPHNHLMKLKLYLKQFQIMVNFVVRHYVIQIKIFA